MLFIGHCFLSILQLSTLIAFKKGKEMDANEALSSLEDLSILSFSDFL